MKNQPVTFSRLHEVLSYEPETGVFRWRISSGGVIAGKVAGSFHNSGYRVIRVDKTQYSEHRLAWFYVYGEWPTKEIDHINRDPCDNRIANLREVTSSQNKQNTGIYKNNTSGFRGVSWNKKARKWQARIKVNKKRKNLGSFDSKESAYAAYLQAASEIHTHNPYVLKESQQ